MDLARTQVLSLIAKAITTVLGIVQSIIIVRLLSPAEFGLVGLVMSIGGVVGVTQHLGIVDGAIREIAVLTNKRDIGKVFWVSHLVRQLVTVPVSLLLLAGAGALAALYGRPEIVSYIQLFAGILILQGLQDVLGATLTGMKKFVALYVVQIVTAALNIAVFGYLVWQFGVPGFFWAVMLTTLVMVLFFVGVVRRELSMHLQFPVWRDLLILGRRVMKIGAFMYVSRIFFVVWQRLPILLLGGVLAADELGYLNVSLTFGARLTIIAMALSEVNLAWMSSLFVARREEFQHVVARNMHRVFILMMTLTLFLLFFTPEILRYIIGSEYLPAHPLVVIMTVAFFLYSLVDIGTSSVFVSANQPRLRTLVYGLMNALSAVFIAALLFLNPHALFAAWAVLLGASAAYVSMVVWAHRRFGIILLAKRRAFLLVIFLASVIWLLYEPSLIVRIGVLCLLMVFVVWDAVRSQLVPDLRKLGLGLSSANTISSSAQTPAIICFAGAPYDQVFWTNRQHMMSRVSQRYPVLYIEPRIWVFRYIATHIRQPKTLFSFFYRLFWYERKDDKLFIKAQWNLIPGSREFKAIAWINHQLNRWCILLTARWLGFSRTDPALQVMWLYDTEAAEYLNAFPRATILYDCVDDHAAQAGVDRNPERVREEEDRILQRADLVTVTSLKLLELKKLRNPAAHLVLNAGDVTLYSAATVFVPPELEQIPHPRFGTVGTLDSYKFDFSLLRELAIRKPSWHFILIGGPLVDHTAPDIEALTKLSNVHFLGAIPRQDVPAYVHQFDVCLIPYRDNTYNRASFPLKFWEFMATGKPIVVSGLPELRNYQPSIGYAQSVEEFIRLCEEWIAHPTRFSNDRVSATREHSWEERVERMLALLKPFIEGRSRDENKF